MNSEGFGEMFEGDSFALHVFLTMSHIKRSGHIEKKLLMFKS